VRKEQTWLIAYLREWNSVSMKAAGSDRRPKKGVVVGGKEDSWAPGFSPKNEQKKRVADKNIHLKLKTNTQN